jgi:hypothetical protein
MVSGYCRIVTFMPQHPAGSQFGGDMPRLRNGVLSAVRVITGLTCCMLFGVAAARADTLPASVRACIGDADAARRLACYDREVARAIAPPDTFSAPAAPAAPAAAAAPASTTLPPASAATPPDGPRHLTAKVSAVRQSGDNLIVTLDNGDVWVQSAPATSQVNLRPGDTVTLDREISSWFLSNRYGDSIQVRMRQR